MTNRESLNELVAAQTKRFGSDPTGNYFTNYDFVKESLKVMDELDINVKYPVGTLAYYNDNGNNQLYVELEGVAGDPALNNNEYLTIQVNEDDTYMQIRGPKGVNEQIYLDEINGMNRHLVNAIRNAIGKMAAREDRLNSQFSTLKDRVKTIIEGTELTIVESAKQRQFGIKDKDGDTLVVFSGHDINGELLVEPSFFKDKFNHGKPIVEMCERLNLDKERAFEIFDVFANIRKLVK